MRKILLLGGAFAAALLLAALVFWLIPGHHPPKNSLPPKAVKPAVADPVIAFTPPKATAPLPQGIHPVLNGYSRLLGGVVDGRWRQRDEVARLLAGEEIYGFYSRQAKIGEDPGPPEIIEQSYITGEHGYYLNFGKFFPDTAFGLCGTWNPLPRIPEIRPGADLPSYLPIVTSVLARKKIKAQGMQIKEALTVDLEGDGQTETLIYATNIRAEEVDALCNGEVDKPYDRCSMVLLGRAGGQTVVLAESSEGMTEYQVPFTADIDGDGIMEVMILANLLDALPAEGFSLSNERLLKIVGEQIQTMTEINSSPV